MKKIAFIFMLAVAGILLTITYSSRDILTTDIIYVTETDETTVHKMKWSDVESFVETNVETFPSSVTFTSGLTTSSDITNTGVNDATLGSATGGTFVTYGSRANQTVITFSDYHIPIVDSEGNGGHGSLKLIDFPAGMIDINGIVADVSIDSVSGIAADGTFDMGLGTATVGTDNAVLAGAEQDLVNKVDGTLVTGADTIDLVNVTLANLDGHTTAKDCYFNVAVTDANMTDDGWMAIYGTIVITWINLGDY